MKKIIASLLAFIILASIFSVNLTTYAENTVLDSGKCGDTLYWELLSDGTLHIFGDGRMYDYVKYVEASPWYKYRNEPYISEDGTQILNSDGSVYLSSTNYYKDNPKGYKVEKIVIDEGVTYIGDWAFYRVCVEELTIPEGVTETGYFCIRYSPTLKTVNLPNSLKVLDDFAISRNYALTTINFGNSLEKIGTGGLKDNTSLESVILPKSCISINKQLSPAYTGAKIDYNATGLMENNISLKYVDFGSVSEIPQRTCLGNAIENVVIPNTVSNIGEYAFYSCTQLKSVRIPVSLTKVEAHAFLNCNELTDVYYDGSEEEWNEISFAINNSAVTSSNIHFAIVKGDGNGDREVTSLDVRIALQYIADLILLTPEEIKNLDMNNDGKVTVLDVRYILQVVAGLA